MNTQTNRPARRKNSGQCRAFFESSVQVLFVCLIALANGVVSAALPQDASAEKTSEIVIHGIVLNVEGKPVGGALVQLEREDHKDLEKETTEGNGTFAFSVSNRGDYSLIAEKMGRHSVAIKLAPSSKDLGTRIELILDQQGSAIDNSASSRSPLMGAMQFADQPNFTVAGVTDFTAVGGHGSDSALRTSEALAVETSNLKADAHPRSTPAGGTSSVASGESEARLRTAVASQPTSFEANHALGEFYFQAGRFSESIPWLQSAYRIRHTDRDNGYDLALACRAIGDPAHSRKYIQELLAQSESADLFRIAGELDESLGDSLAAVHEYQKAASLDPSEQNFFEWGSELLLHRAIWQAQRVFEEGAKKYPASSRMLTGLGTALFSGAAYGEAALRLCDASDLKPSDSEPYLFLGKVQMAAPNRLDCVEQRLRRFLQQQPKSAVANFLYAVALQKKQDSGQNTDSSQESETLLRTAIAIDPRYAEAYLQLGILYASRGNYSSALDLYTKAIAADPQLSDAYYRLAVAYDRTGQAAKAKEEFKRHEEIAKQQAAEAEHQRQEVKQFLVVLPAQAPQAQTP